VEKQGRGGKKFPGEEGDAGRGTKGNLRVLEGTDGIAQDFRSIPRWNVMVA